MQLHFAKGHGTGNDFVLIADPDGEYAIGEREAATLANRHTGIGGDGVIVARKSASIDEDSAQAAAAAGADWFMDYRNADGSLSEMCGNGIRVFAQFLVEEGLVDGEAAFAVGTRAGVKLMERVGAEWRASMGTWSVEDGERLVLVDGLEVPRPGLAVSVGNPHVVVALADADKLDTIDLHAAPTLEPPAPLGANVEFVVPGSIGTAAGAVRMRVHERGVGETLSCGTGAVASAIATRFWIGEGAPDRWFVDVPGGRLEVEVDGDQATLAGPAVIVYRGTVTL